ATLAPYFHRWLPGRPAVDCRLQIADCRLSGPVACGQSEIGNLKSAICKGDAMSYSLATLWYERQRYLPGVLAVAFSAMLIALQCGLLLGLFSITSIPVDHTRAHVWVGAPEVLSVDLGRPIPENFLSRLANQPEVETPDGF